MKRFHVKDDAVVVVLTPLEAQVLHDFYDPNIIHRSPTKRGIQAYKRAVAKLEAAIQLASKHPSNA